MQKRTPPLQGESSGKIQPPKKRHNRKRRNWHPIIRRVCALMLLAEIAYLLLGNPYLRVTHVRIDGLQTLPPQQVFAEARVPAHTNIFLMLAQRFSRRLTQDPVIDSVKPSIELPRTLVLTVTERQPYAIMTAQDQYWVLDKKGIPFRTLDAPPPNVPLLQLQDAAPDQIVLGKPLQMPWLHDAYTLLALISDRKNMEVAKIKVDQNANLCLNRKDNLQIKLGQPDGLPQKVALAQATLSWQGGAIARRAAYIDVSCPDQPVWMPRKDAPQTDTSSGDAAQEKQVN